MRKNILVKKWLIELCVVFMVIFGVIVFSNTYSHGMEGFWIKYDDGSYSYEEDGNLVTGWKNIDGYWYHFDDGGLMEVGKVALNDGEYYLSPSGAMKIGWAKDNDTGKWYFADDSGKLFSGWKKLGSLWYFMADNKEMQTGKLSLPEGKYYLAKSGEMIIGWAKDDSFDTWYYADDNGELKQNKWFYDNNYNAWYYLTSDGSYAQNKWKDKYFLKKDGKMAINEWIYDNEYKSYFYLKSDGCYLENGWIKTNGTWYYLKSGGYMAKNEETPDGYFVDETGAYIYLKDIEANRGLAHKNPVIENFVRVMESWYGYSEANGRYKTIIDLYNSIRPLPVGYKVKYSDEWCDATVSAAAYKAGITYLVGAECGCERHVSIFKKKDIWEEDGKITPKRGDIILYSWRKNKQPNDEYSDHIGVVTKVEKGIITVIEGNTLTADSMAPGVFYRKIAVGAGNIRGFAIL